MNESLIAQEAPQTECGSYDYERVEKAITFLTSHFLEQPDLATVARAVHLSEYHFQRLFTRWAGISPKRFLQFLTVEYAKRQLAGSKALLETALNSGLSSPSRLHDLFVSVESVTPGEYKTRGAGIHIGYGFCPTPFGLCLLGFTRRGVCWLSFLEGASKDHALREIKSDWSGATFTPQPAAAASMTNRVFLRLEEAPKSPLGLLLMGTNFQLKVWRALLAIPAGSMVSYGRVAEMVGIPNACRAVGTAVGSNRIAYLIPCHRVIRETGLLGGYRWGGPRKRAMLAWEAASSIASLREDR